MVARRAVVELEAAAAAAAGEAVEELREPAGEAALERVPALLRHRVVRVVAVVEPLAELCACMYKRQDDDERECMSCANTRGYAPGSLSTSYASLTAAIFASLPPLSGCAVNTALRLMMRRVRRHVPSRDGVLTMPS